jgi:UDP-2,3-diacylglucosamine pyrophosphatase LpxH
MNQTYQVEGVKRLLSVSDLHLEFYKDQTEAWPYVLPEADPDALLLLNGDVQLWCYGGKFKVNSPVFRLLKHLSERFRAVVYVPGNHEYYRGLVGHYYDNKFRHYLSELKLDNVFLLNNDQVLLNGGQARLLGSTLWTSMDEGNPLFELEVSRSANSGRSPLNDFNYVRFTDDKTSFPKLNVRSVRKLHARSVLYLKAQLHTPFEGETLVATHHLPSLSLVQDEFLGHRLTPSYAEPLDELVAYADLWLFGHSHVVTDRVLAHVDTRVVSNAAGYRGQLTKGFDPNKVFHRF